MFFVYRKKITAGKVIRFSCGFCGSAISIEQEFCEECGSCICYEEDGTIFRDYAGRIGSNVEEYDPGALERMKKRATEYQKRKDGAKSKK